MKIGILTFHRADNFGAALQSYALQTYLQRKGYDARIVDYRCEAIEQVYSILNYQIFLQRKNLLKSISIFCFNLWNYREMYSKKKAYDLFRSEYLKLSNCNNKEIENLNYDAYIAGSDQIWNFSLLHGLNKYYFLDFPMPAKALRISYAASSEIASFHLFKRYQDDLIRLLESFDFLSVRENQLKDELANYTHKDISVCIDPTFLLGCEDYEKILIKPLETNYILVYHMSETQESVELANFIAERKGLMVVEIHASFYSNKGKRHKRGLGPLEIAGYIKYADTVITNSFHGGALSIILNKELWVINRYESARLKTLLSNAGLLDRYIKSKNEFKENVIDYSKVKSKLESYISTSEQYLNESLNFSCR